MRDRKRQRENRRKKHYEEILDKRNNYGFKDMTAYEAVLNIRNKEIQAMKKPPSNVKVEFLCPIEQ